MTFELNVLIKCLSEQLVSFLKIAIMAKRWIVERTLAWLNWSRRLSKAYEMDIRLKKL